MGKSYKITSEEVFAIKKARSQNKDKQVEKRLYSVQLRYTGRTNQEIAELLETSSDMVSRWVSAFAKGGIEALLPKKRKGRPREMSEEDETAFLEGYRKQAELGQIIDVSEIKSAYESKVGHRIGGSQIYYILKRHGWRKIMPRSKHPSKASEAEIEASKKLTAVSEN